MGLETISILLLAILSGVLNADIDYCDEKYCPYQGRHVACNNDGSFSSDCEGSYKLVAMDPYIKMILHEHNTYRNYVASGDLKCFYPATRMPALTWDWNLAKNAEYNVKTCKFAHDKCRSTPKFKFAGQNIYYAKTSKQNITYEQFMVEAMFLWFEEYLDADHHLMESFHKTEPQTGHYTIMANDRETKVGCAYLDNVIQGRKKVTRVIFTCDYTSSNLRGKPSYQAGQPAADCKQRNSVYPYLCDDEVDPNDFNWYY